MVNYDFYFKLLGGEYDWYLVSYFKFSDMIKYMNSSAIKTFHGTNQAGNYMDFCDRGLYLKHNCTKNSEWFENSHTIKSEDIFVNFNLMKTSSSKLNCYTKSYYFDHVINSKEDLAF